MLFTENLIDSKTLSTTQQRRNFILDLIQKNAQSCKDDKILMGSIIHMGPDGYLLKTNGDSVEFTTWAEDQLLGRLKIQAGYLHRCPDWLQAANVNHWILLHAQKEILLRWKNEKVRAVFSTRFKPELDDVFLYPVVLEGLEKSCIDGNVENLHIREFCQTEDFTLMRAFFKNYKVEASGQTYYAGVTVINSEVGRSSIWVKPTIRGGNVSEGVFDYIDRYTEGCTSIRHVSEMDEERIQKAVNEALEVAQVGIHRILEAGNEKVEKPIEEIRALVRSADFLTQRMSDILEQEYKEIQETTRLNLAKSVLRAIKELPLFQRYLAECEVGRYLGLFESTKQRAQAITTDIIDSEAL